MLSLALYEKSDEIASSQLRTNSNPFVDNSALLVTVVVAPNKYGIVVAGPSISEVTRLYQSKVNPSLFSRKVASTPKFKVVIVSQVILSLIMRGTTANGGRASSRIQFNSGDTSIRER